MLHPRFEHPMLLTGPAAPGLTDATVALERSSTPVAPSRSDATDTL